MLSLWQRVPKRLLKKVLCLTENSVVLSSKPLPPCCFPLQRVLAAATTRHGEGKRLKTMHNFLAFHNQYNQCPLNFPPKIGVRGLHSYAEDFKMGCMKVKVLPTLKDNYMYLILCNATKEAAAVDPVDPESILAAVEKEDVQLTKVLVTHHHADHAGGNEQLRELFQKPLKIHGGDERIACMNCRVYDGDCLEIGNIRVRCICTPGHTSGHICYYAEAPNGEKCVFTGDTLFQGGCGRLIEGTPEQMYASLILKLSALPNETKVFCGHEYTLQNLTFARHVEPKNSDILNRIDWAKCKRAKEWVTVPSTIAQEKSWNPFMRVHCDAVMRHAGECDPVCTMSKLRAEKDNFKA